MHEDVVRSRARITRRQALAASGSVALGALLAGCGLGGGGSGGAVELTTSTGATTSVTPTAPVGDGVIALLDAAPTCRLSSEETQGPYWFDVDSIRSDIREDRPGTRLDLALRVQDVTGCQAGGTATPVPDCVVEIWHCDAGGEYSGFESSSAGPGDSPGGPGGGGRPQGSPPDAGGAAPPAGGAPGVGGAEAVSDGSYSVGVPEATPTGDATYLRGAQVAGADGVVRFTTIFPGWYRGRTVHIHLKVHINRVNVLTTQLYFEEDVIAAVYAEAPYDDRPQRDVMNDADGIFDAGGMLAASRTADGYRAVINLGIDA